MSATQVLERFGLWVLVRFLVLLTIFTIVAVVRLPVLWLAGALTWGMHHTDRLMTTPPPRPYPRPGRRTGGSSMHDNNTTAQPRRPAGTGHTEPTPPPVSTPDASSPATREASRNTTAEHDTSRDTGATRHDTTTATTVPASRHHRFASWIVWHGLELSAVAVPLALAVWVTAWFLAPAVFTALLWTVNEIRLARRQRAMTSR